MLRKALFVKANAAELGSFGGPGSHGLDSEPVARYRPERDVRPAFLNAVREWVGLSGEVFVALRYLAAAGAKDYALCHSFTEFEALVSYVALGTDIVAFRDRQLPYRGVVTDEFAACALEAFPEGVEYLLVTLETRTQSSICLEDAGGDTQDDLRALLVEYRGREVALGPYPQFWEPDSQAMVSASKGGIDGPR